MNNESCCGVSLSWPNSYYSSISMTGVRETKGNRKRNNRPPGRDSTWYLPNSHSTVTLVSRGWIRTTRNDILSLCFFILSRVRVSATVNNCWLRNWSRFIWMFTVMTTVVRFTNVQHINQGLVFWYHFTFDCSGPLLSGVFLALNCWFLLSARSVITVSRTV
jgi:hypothetical protein